jgi:hypothetical protein
MHLPVREFRAREFRSLKAITYPVSNLDVLVGGNGVGKTNLYRALELSQSAAGPGRRPGVDPVGRAPPTYTLAKRSGSAIPAGMASGSLHIGQQVAQRVSSVTMERMAALRRRH